MKRTVQTLTRIAVFGGAFLAVVIIPQLIALSLGAEITY